MKDVELEIAETSQASRNERGPLPRILVATSIATAVIVLLWLGSTTPAQILRVTTTVEQGPAIEIEQHNTVEPKTPTWDIWTAETDSTWANRSSLEVTFSVFVGGSPSHILEVSPSGVESHELECDADVPYHLPQLLGQLQQLLVMGDLLSACVAPSDGTQEPLVLEWSQEQPLDRGRSPYERFVPINERSGWLCTSPGSDIVPLVQVVKYSIGESLTQGFESASCPLLASEQQVLFYEWSAASQDWALHWITPGASTAEVPVIDSDECDWAGLVPPYLLCRTDVDVEVVSLMSGTSVAILALSQLPEGFIARGDLSPDGNQLALLRTWTDNTETQESIPSLPPLILDLNTSRARDLSSLKPTLGQNKSETLTWITNSQLAILSQIDDCIFCSYVIEVLDTDSLLSAVAVELPSEIHPHNVVVFR